MATYGANDAVYGSGTFGTARFGRVTPVISVTGVSGTGQVEPPEIGGFEVDIGVRLTATTVGTASVGSIPTSQVHVGAGLTGVTATVSVGQVSIANEHNLASVFASSAIGSVGVGSSHTLTGVTATAQVGTATKTNVSEIIVSSGMTSSLGSVTATAVVFDFEAVKNLYSKRRTVIIARAA